MIYETRAALEAELAGLHSDLLIRIEFLYSSGRAMGAVEGTAHMLLVNIQDADINTSWCRLLRHRPARICYPV